MGVEIERKFLLAGDGWREKAGKGNMIRQGYLNSNIERTVRVRVTNCKGTVNIKSKNKGTTRLEYEYDIPMNEAIELLSLCEQPIIEKTRYEIEDNGKTWEVDEFAGHNKGLVVAEIELNQEDESISLPEWVGPEVSHDSKYYNSSLLKHPFREW
ncbi:MAG: CYTH domain-containing protein [Bacteroidota bacterium]